MRELFRPLFSGTEIKLLGCYHTEAGLKSCLTKNPPDVLLMDLVLPGVRSLALIKEIRLQYPGVFVVVMSGLKEESILSLMFQAGVHDFIAKPFRSGELVQTIRQVVAGGGSQKVAS